MKFPEQDEFTIIEPSLTDAIMFAFFDMPDTLNQISMQDVQNGTAEPSSQLSEIIDSRDEAPEPSYRDPITSTPRG